MSVVVGGGVSPQANKIVSQMSLTGDWGQVSPISDVQGTGGPDVLGGGGGLMSRGGWEPVQ